MAKMRSVRLSSNAATCCALIGACGLAQQWQRALWLLGSMRATNLVLNVAVSSSAISACERAAQWQRALLLLRRSEVDQVLPDTIMFSASISAAEKGGQWQHALALLSEAQAQGLASSVIMHSSVISAMEKSGEWQLALGILTEMRAARLQADVVAFNAAISACEKGGSWEQALALLTELGLARLAPSLTTFNALSSACSRGSRWKDSLRIFDSMRKAGLSPDIVSCSAVLTAAEKAGQWQCLLQASFPTQGLATRLLLLGRDHLEAPTRALTSVLGFRAEVTGSAARLLDRRVLSPLRRGLSGVGALVSSKAGKGTIVSLGHVVFSTVDAQALAQVPSLKVDLGSTGQPSRNAGVRNARLLSAALLESAWSAASAMAGMWSSVVSLHLLVQCKDLVAFAKGLLGIIWAQAFLEVLRNIGSELVDGAARAAKEDAEEAAGRSNVAWHPEMDHGFLHRLDVPSSGLILCGTTFLGEQGLDTYRIERQYVDGAQVVANIDPASIDSKKSFVSEALVAAHLILPLNPVDFRATASPVSACSAFAIRIRTGRRHQIRAHLLHIGFPTLVDCKYAAKSIYIAHLSKLEEAFLQAGCPQE
ncbi:unnamed protein product [Polarella glacialis]|uniref:Pseudouridine synthase RsuA/RluA-like domain-containing protein n=1 Tax=Polarella glacialis TaxID=89957 RepID=A0A813H4A7_POLGL|nr:unnamed protein product [Polarella glacialis]